MSTATGDVTPLEIPLPPRNDAELPEVLTWLNIVMINIQEWAFATQQKTQEFDALTTDSQALGLTTFAADATVSKIDGGIYAFDGDPNAGVPGAGTPGFYRWNSSSSSWIKY